VFRCKRFLTRYVHFQRPSWLRRSSVRVRYLCVIVFTDIWTCARVWRIEGVSAVLDHGFVDHGFVARNAE